jgi:hypothetical protein
MLAAVPAHLVVPEAGVVDTVLRAGYIRRRPHDPRATRPGTGRDDPCRGVEPAVGRLLPAFVASDLVDAWCLALEAGERELMLAVARRDAKNPVLAHRDDRAAKQAMVTPEIRVAAERWLAPLYERLESARTGARAV